MALLSASSPAFHRADHDLYRAFLARHESRRSYRSPAALRSTQAGLGMVQMPEYGNHPTGKRPAGRLPQAHQGGPPAKRTGLRPRQEGSSERGKAAILSPIEGSVTRLVTLSDHDPGWAPRRVSTPLARLSLGDAEGRWCRYSILTPRALTMNVYGVVRGKAGTGETGY
jgi:hypothetical protein